MYPTVSSTVSEYLWQWFVAVGNKVKCNTIMISQTVHSVIKDVPKQIQLEGTIMY